jgi:flavorubredoxin
MPTERLRYIGFSHFEADECGSLNEFLAVAPAAGLATAPRY